MIAEKTKYEVVGKNGSFVAYDNGVVYDLRTGLEWFTGSDKDTSRKID